MAQHQQVSFDEELLILVDEQDNVTGYESKYKAHCGNGLLHRAFSIFIFSASGKVLLQQRSAHKPLWPAYWSNSCCSHPRKGESYADAAHRRLHEELGIDTELLLLYRFKYAAAFGDLGSERELCTVFVGRVDADCPVHANATEVADWRWVGCNEVDVRVREHPERFTPWFLMEWERLRNEKRAAIGRLCRAEAH